MAYIGSTPTSQNFISGTDYFNGTGSQTAFTLTRTVNSVNDVEVVVNNVVQQPNSYTVSGTTLTLSVAPSSGTSNVYARYLSTTTQTIAPSQGTVTTPTIADVSVTQAKLGSGVAGTGPAFSAYISANQSITSSTWTKVPVNVEEFDTNSNYNTTNYRFTPTVAGYYQVTGNIYFYSTSGNSVYALSLYKNGSQFKLGTFNYPASAPATSIGNVTALIYLNGSTDYIELYGYLTASTSPIFAGGSDTTYFQAVMVRSA